MVHEFHDSVIGGHSGFLRTYKRLSAVVLWRGMKRFIRDYVAHCEICQQNESEDLSPVGLLQPLPIPDLVWDDVSMNFVGGLPKSGGFDTILVVVDRLSKYAHFCPLAHPYAAKQVAALFVSHIVKLHGVPRSIVSDRDAIFMSGFWRELFKLQGTKLYTSSAYHPESDGQTEVVNCCLEGYLRCFAPSSHCMANLHIPKAVVSSEDDGEQSKYSGLTSQLVPNFDEVESLLSTICDTTSIAEFEMKLSGFRLHVRRKLTEEVNTSPPPSAAPTSAYNVIAESSDLNGFVSTPSLAITKSETSSKNIQTLVDRAADAGLVIIRSPRVGFFRRSRTIKGKRAPPPCKEKQEVKEGQVVCYIEQLGGELPIESDVSGEVIKILREDGDAVGYNDPLIAILPSFPGIKKLQ
ncbi:uncharacterized protein LOC21408495 [Morus notabilis]|uniref:uncharacterized protein LOC21408495 n=1 Tax=Morus notabilis TaxID=981085 RepID=UPI000CECF1D5|nr:uncharacterized protein LOC21408495 [Morus notabilis]